MKDHVHRLVLEAFHNKGSLTMHGLDALSIEDLNEIVNSFSGQDWMEVAKGVALLAELEKTPILINSMFPGAIEDYQKFLLEHDVNARRLLHIKSRIVGTRLLVIQRRAKENADTKTRS